MAKGLDIPISYVIILIVLFIIIPGISRIPVMYSDLLWFETLGYGSVYMTILTTEAGIFLVATLLCFTIISVNAYIADRGKKKEEAFREKYIAILALSAIVGFTLIGSWETVLRYLNQAQFGVTDPIFSKDIGFYVFTLPFYRLIQDFLFYIIALTMIFAAITYIKNGNIIIIKEEKEYVDENIPKYQLPAKFFEASGKVKAHFYSLAGFLWLLLTWKHYLDRYDVLYSESGVIYGASYADITAYLPVLSVLVYIPLLAAVMFLAASILELKKKTSVWGSLMAVVIVYVLILLVGTGAYPALIQQYKVTPNEIALEKEYIENNIRYTRQAYGLDNIQDSSITPNGNITMEYILENEEVIENIRLWDWRPLKQTYKQIQEIRSYYEFNDVDVDRYTLEGEYTQVLLSARELDHEQLSSEAKTWVNEHLLYTHGYGLCMSPVNKFTEGGLPEFIVKDIPPKSTLEELRIDRPEIYYGEGTGQFVIVKTTTEEFDYPVGDENKYTSYSGTGGVELTSFIKKLTMSIRFGDINLMLSEYITPESRIMLNRNIHQRVNEIAPFLIYDSDPYAVTVNGKIYWIQDAYTHTNKYPYSTPYGGLNYIRNPVKVVIDAYNGNTEYYVTDPKDPLIKTYRDMFPDLFHSFEDMPEDLKKHTRYPEALFTLQANVYGVYHMTNPTVFYNKEDKWIIPYEIYGQGIKQEMVPYYIITRLPGEENLEFILMIPLTPRGKDNMIAWMVARCDEEYGKLIIYKFPKEKLIYGPMQIEARIDQDDEISQQLTLWGQRGSDVIRGNLLVIPLDDALLYVEPLYIKAEKATMPELKRVIVSYKSKVVMEKTLKQALSKLFEVDVEEIPREEEGEDRTIEELIELALRHYSNAESHIMEGNWTGFGKELKNMENALLDMKNINEERS